MTENEFNKLWTDSVIAMHAWASHAKDSEERAQREGEIQYYLASKMHIRQAIIVYDRPYKFCETRCRILIID